MEQDLASEPSYSGQKKKMNTWKVLTIVFILLFVAAIFTKGFTLLSITGSAVLSQDSAKTKANDFIQKYLIGPGVTIDVNKVSEESGLYALNMTANSNGVSQAAKAYITKDGKLFFLQAIPLDEIDNLLNQQQPADNPQDIELQPADNPSEIILGLDDDPKLGDDNAKVSIVEFSDFECPFCGNFVRETFEDLKREYIDTGKVSFVFKNFPLNTHKNAMIAALASECANEQGKFWEYHNKLFRSQKSLEKKDLKEYAADLKLDTAKFNTCLDSEKYKDEVSKDIEEGTGLGVRGTPTFYINGRALSGALPLEEFENVINEELSKT